jgi:predicted nucleic acid-binding protein
MIVVDTTVLVYAVGTDHALRQPCRDFVQAVLDRRIEATTTVEVIQELVHVRGRRGNRQDAADIGRDFADLLAPLLTVSYEDLVSGMAIYARNERLGAFDSVLAGAASRHGASAIVSADRAFAGGIDVRHVVPDADGIAALLG